jgi:hypothetical protein
LKVARSRNIKPGFFVNEELVELPYSTRLLFIGLWTIADREGRLGDRPKRIKMAVFPADEVDVNEALDQLAGSGFIVRYTVESEGFIQILNFAKHQNPHINEAESTIPAPYEHGTGTVPLTLIPSSLIPDSLNSDSGLPAAASPASPQNKSAKPKRKRPPKPKGDSKCMCHKLYSVCDHCLEQSGRVTTEIGEINANV